MGNSSSSTNVQAYTGNISSGYTLNSDGTINGTINTLDSTGKTSITSITNLPSLFQNVWGITSPNTNDQILVMTADNKYILAYSYLITLIISIFRVYLPPVENKPPQFTYQTCLYIGLYFILTYGFNPSTPFIAIVNMILPVTSNLTKLIIQQIAPPPIQTLSSTASSTNTPSYTPSYNTEYSTWNQLGSSQPLDKLVKDSYLFYVVCSDIAVNGNLSQYYSKFDNAIITANNIKSSDWTYAANFFYTMYSFASNQEGNFCVTPTAPIDNSDISKALGLTQYDCRINTPASSLINTPSGPYGQGAAAALIVNNKMTIIYIIIGLIICCCCLSLLVFVLTASAKGSRHHKHRNSGGYHYLD